MPSTAAQGGDYGNVRYLAQQLLDVMPSESYEERVSALRSQIESATDADLGQTDLGVTQDGGLNSELLVELLSDSSAQVQDKAIKAYLRWLAMPSIVTKLNVTQNTEVCTAVWTQHYPLAIPEVINRDRKSVV